MFDNMQESLEKQLKILGDGPLTLIICCCKCNAHYELNKAPVAIAIAMNISFIEYLKYVQNSSCKNCENLKEIE